MHGADMISHKFRLSEVRSPLQTDGKGVKTGPVGFRLGIVLDTHLRVFLSDGRDDRRVETTREQHTIRHIAHQLTLHGILKGIVDGLNTGRIILHGIILEPIALIVTFHAWLTAPVIMAWQEGLIALTLTLEGFQF